MVAAFRPLAAGRRTRAAAEQDARGCA